jgi:hypothetical protein
MKYYYRRLVGALGVRIQAIHKLNESPIWDAAHRIVTGYDSCLGDMYKNNVEVNKDYEMFFRYLDEHNEELMNITEKYKQYRMGVVFAMNNTFQKTLDNTRSPCQLDIFRKRFYRYMEEIPHRIWKNDTTLFPLYIRNDMNDNEKRRILATHLSQEFDTNKITINIKIFNPLLDIYTLDRIHGETIDSIVELITKYSWNFTSKIITPVNHYPNSCAGISHAPNFLRSTVEKVLPYWQAGGKEPLPKPKNKKNNSI